MGRPVSAAPSRPDMKPTAYSETPFSRKYEKTGRYSCAQAWYRFCSVSK